MNIKKFIVAIVLFILPLMIGFSIVKGTFDDDNDTRFSVSVLYDYVLVYPSDNIEEIRAQVGELSNIGFRNAELFEPDWSGNVFNDIAEIGRMIADFFIAIWDYIAFSVRVCALSVLLFVDGLVWILGFPGYLITVS